jgi:hypothetical protein
MLGVTKGADGGNCSIGLLRGREVISRFHLRVGRRLLRRASRT